MRALLAEFSDEMLESLLDYYDWHGYERTRGIILDEFERRQQAGA